MQAQDIRGKRADLGRTIRDARQRRDMTQEALALESGLQRKTVHLIEVGKADPRLGTLYRIARAVDAILAQRRKLVADHLAKPRAIPLDVLEEQQTALGEQLTAARKELAKAERDIAKAEKGLQLAKRFLHDSSSTYRDEADPTLRRRWNQVFFKRLFVGPHGITAAELTDEFAALLDDDLPRKLEKLPREPRAFRARGSNVAFLVERGGLEPQPRSDPGRCTWQVRAAPRRFTLRPREDAAPRVTRDTRPVRA